MGKDMFGRPEPVAPVRTQVGKLPAGTLGEYVGEQGRSMIVVAISDDTPTFASAETKARVSLAPDFMQLFLVVGRSQREMNAVVYTPDHNRFPYLEALSARDVIATDFLEEVGELWSQQNDVTRRSYFSYSEMQIQTLAFIDVIRLYLSGKKVEDRPGWIIDRITESSVRRIFEVLREVVPLCADSKPK